MSASGEWNVSHSCDLPGFGTLGPEQLLAQDSLFAVAWDKYPVSPGHCLIIAKRKASLFCELKARERTRLMRWIEDCLVRLKEMLRPTPDGFNIGLNDGATAGQTIPQFHVHIIPRYKGDVADPRGGVRWIMPEKARYWDKDKAQLEKATAHPDA